MVVGVGHEEPAASIDPQAAGSSELMCGSLPLGDRFAVGGEPLDHGAKVDDGQGAIAIDGDSARLVELARHEPLLADDAIDLVGGSARVATGQQQRSQQENVPRHPHDIDSRGWLVERFMLLSYETWRRFSFDQEGASCPDSCRSV